MKELDKDIKSQLTVNVMFDGELDEELTKFEDIEIKLYFGIFFCPITCKVTTNVEEEIRTFEFEESGATGICFEIFTKLFQTLKTKNLVQDFYLDELECSIDASHPNYPYLKNLTSLFNIDYYGIAFWIGDIPNSRKASSEELSFMKEVILILNDLKNEYPILNGIKFQAGYHLSCNFITD